MPAFNFAQFSDQWWDPQGPFRTLHQVNPLRAAFIDHQTPLNGRHVLDIGCGGGILAETMALRGAVVTAIDPAAENIHIAISHAQQKELNITYQCVEAHQLLPQQKNYYDTVVCMEVLEHVVDPAALVATCAALLKPDGQAFFSTLNRSWRALIFAKFTAEYVLRMLPKGTHDFAAFIRPSQLDQWLRCVKMEITALRGISYRPWRRDFYLSNDVSINYLARADLCQQTEKQT